jgi:acyl-coenzyme A synthetase/AMP-(fatty) acid ligase
MKHCASTLRGACPPDPSGTATAVPLVRGLEAAGPFALVRGRSVTLAQFLGDVQRVAARLPARRHVFNVCADRYRFAVAFAAALCRGQVSLLPPTRTPDFLARLAERYPDTYCVADEAVGGMPFDVVPLEDAPGSGDGPMPAFAAEQVAAISFTSGSTGAPTPHLKRWGALAQGATAEADALAFDMPARPALVGTVPPQHMYGFESTVLLALHGGCRLVAERPFYPLDVQAALAAVDAPRVLVTTPVHLRALLLEDVALPDLAQILCATAPLPVAFAQQAERRFRAPVREIYGFTEAGMVAARRTLDGPAWTPLAGVRLRADGDDWWAEGGHVPIPARFADLIQVAQDGRFTLQGRRTDVVNVAGKRASLSSLDHHLQSIPGVIDGAYYLPESTGPTARLGAFVVAPGLTARGLRDALLARVDAAFLPRPLHFVDALPRNATGKLTLDALRALERERASRR